MDWLSIILAVFGWGREDAAKVRDRKMEAFRLNAEVAGEALRAIGIVALAAEDLTRRLQALFPGQPDAYKGVTEALATMQSQCQQIYEQAETNKRLIEKAGAWTDWEAGLRRSIEWRATASGFVPQAESMIKNIANAVAEEETRRGRKPPQDPPASPVAFRQRDRGWDAPPL